MSKKTKKIFCPSCGTELDSSHNFCISCGYDLREIEDQVSGVNDSEENIIEDNLSHEEKVDIGLNKKESSIRNKTDAKEEPKEEGAPDAKASSDFQAFSSPHKQSKFDKSEDSEDLYEEKTDGNLNKKESSTYVMRESIKVDNPILDWNQAQEEGAAHRKAHSTSQTSFSSDKFNIWAALFGFAYYIYKGLWKKGMLLWSANLIISAIVNVVSSSFQYNIWLSLLTVSHAVLFGLMAPYDLKRKEKYNETMWKVLPDIFKEGSTVIAAGVLSLFLAVYTLQIEPSLSEIEITSTEVTNDILLQEGIFLSATNVTITNEVYENLYEGYADLSNGETIRITIDYIPPRSFGDYDYYVYVEIPYTELTRLYWSY